MNPRKPDLYSQQEPDTLRPVVAKAEHGMQYRESIMSVPTPDGKLATLHLPAYMTGFLLDIDRMNEMYRMPQVSDSPDSWNHEKMDERLNQFKSILWEECTEIDDILTKSNFQSPQATLVMLADLLGDIIVYCASEAKRWGIPIDRTLNIIMQSNFSKLDENGQPIYDERMKLLKGPGYWKPEPKIAELLNSLNGEANV